MRLDELRTEIDDIDRILVAAFAKRLDICREIGAYKVANSLPVKDTSREQAKLDMVEALVTDDKKTYVRELYEHIFEITCRIEE